jgi:hypothetical protein
MNLKNGRDGKDIKANYRLDSGGEFDIMMRDSLNESK